MVAAAAAEVAGPAHGALRAVVDRVLLETIRDLAGDPLLNAAHGEVVVLVEAVAQADLTLGGDTEVVAAAPAEVHLPLAREHAAHQDRVHARGDVLAPAQTPLVVVCQGVVRCEQRRQVRVGEAVGVALEVRRRRQQDLREAELLEVLDDPHEIGLVAGDDDAAVRLLLQGCPAARLQ